MSENEKLDLGGLEIIGLGDLTSKLAALGGSIEEALKQGILDAGKRVEDSAKNLAPVSDPQGGGHLREEIKRETTVTNGVVSAVIGSYAEYAAYVEFGTGQRGEKSPSPPKWDGDLVYRHDWSGMAAQPYLYPAFKDNEEACRQDVENAVKAAIARLSV